MKRIFNILMLCCCCLAVYSQTTVSAYFPDNSNLIDQRGNLLMKEAQLRRQKDGDLKAAQLFADRNLNAGGNGFATANGNGSGHFSVTSNQTWYFDNSFYRLPTEEEMMLFAPDFNNVEECPSFTGDGKIQDKHEKLRIDGEFFSGYSDYVSRGKGIIYGLRFKKRADTTPADNPRRTAYRYQIIDGMLIISMKFVGDDPKIKRVRDVDDEKWWAMQTDVVKKEFPLFDGSANYICKQNRIFRINQVTLSIANLDANDRVSIRPYYDVEQTYKSNTLYMYHTIYGTNVEKTDNIFNTKTVNLSSFDGAQVKVYLKCNPAKASLKFLGSALADCNVELKERGQDNYRYNINIGRNLSQTARSYSFCINNTVADTMKREFVIYQPSLKFDRSANFDDVPDMDYVYTETDSLEDESILLTSFLKATKQATNAHADTVGYIPEKHQLACIFPCQTVAFNQQIDIAVDETVTYGDNENIACTSRYYGIGNGTVYALRFLDTDFPCAFRYVFDKNDGLVVSVLPLGTSAYFTRAKEVAHKELFDRSDVIKYTFPCTGDFDGNYEGQVGCIWTSSPDPENAHDNVLCYRFSNRNIEMIGLDATADYKVGILSFVGEHHYPGELNGIFSKERKNVRVEEDATQKPHAKKHSSSTRKSVTNRRSSNSSNSSNSSRNRIITVDKTK